MITVNFATVKIVHLALFGGDHNEVHSGSVDSCVSKIKAARADWSDLFTYALAISENSVEDPYVTLPNQLRSVIVERDLVRKASNNWKV